MTGETERSLGGPSRNDTEQKAPCLFNNSAVLYFYHALHERDLWRAGSAWNVSVRSSAGRKREYKAVTWRTNVRRRTCLRRGSSLLASHVATQHLHEIVEQLRELAGHHREIDVKLLFLVDFLAFGVFLLLHDVYALPLTQYNAAQYTALARLNVMSAGMLTAFVAILFSGILAEAERSADAARHEKAG